MRGHTRAEVRVQQRERLVHRSQRRAPSLLTVNVYLLLSLGLLVAVGHFTPDRAAIRYAVGIALEGVLAGGALLLARWESRSVRRTLRLRWVGWTPLVLSAIIGVGVWIVSVGINAVMVLLTGYVTPVSPTAYPSNALEAVLLLTATVLAAPLCEEVIFRGYVQRAYERWGSWTGILLAGSVFVLYHLRFQGLPSLVPVTLTLGIIAWRTDSLWPAVVLHAVYNSLASLVTVATTALPLLHTVAFFAVLIGFSLTMLPLSLVAFWLLWRQPHAPSRLTYPPTPAFHRWVSLAAMGLLLVVYGYAAAVELTVGRFPTLLAVEAIEPHIPQTWSHASRWRYTAYDPLNRPIGEVSCTLKPASDHVSLSCEGEHESFSPPFSTGWAWLDEKLSGEAAAQTWIATWNRADLQLASLREQRRAAGETFCLTVATISHALTAVTSHHGQEVGRLSVPADLLVEDEWPWRMGGLPFKVGYGAYVPYLYTEGGVPRLVRAYLLVERGEPIWTPAGNFVAWKVTVQYETSTGKVTRSAWYDARSPHTLLQYDADKVIYRLAGEE